MERWQGIRGSRGKGRAKRKTRRKEQRERNEGAGQRESAEREGREGGGGWRPVVVAGGWVAAREGARGGSTVNSPIQCSYHLPLSLTTHRRRPRPPSCAHPLAPRQPSAAPYLPACLLACLPACPGFASRTFLVLLANLIDISQFLTPLPVPAGLLRLPFSLSSLYRVLPLPLALLPRALRVRPQRVRRGGRELREERHLPSLQSHFRESGTGQRRAAPRRAKPRRAGWAALFSLTLDARVANIYLHIVLHVMIM